ncbi:MAG: hypothetical protein IPN79_18125 [Saprospiraceae bacterium]|nr:hypothetical protein [Saprospiraceae bacterium]
MKKDNNQILKLVSYFFILTGISWFTFWWVVPVVVFIISYLFFQHAGKAFLLHFLFLFLLWFATSYIKDGQVDGAVSAFLASLSGGLPKVMTYVISGLIGGAFAGWAAYLGVMLRRIVAVNKPLR